MIIATERRTSNIAEYILYMWQLEDIIRSFKFDIELLTSNMYGTHQNLPEIKIWYNQMAETMKQEGIERKGHLMSLKELVQDLSSLNINLLKHKKDEQYTQLFHNAMPIITDLIDKSNNAVKNEIDACFTALYGYLMLKLQKKTITPETQEATNTLSILLAKLSYYYKLSEQGKLDF